MEYNTLTIAQLKEIANKNKVSYSSKVKKDELIGLLATYDYFNQYNVEMLKDLMKFCELEFKTKDNKSTLINTIMSNLTLIQKHREAYYNSITVAKLKEIAKVKNLEFTSKTSKQQLIDLLLDKKTTAKKSKITSEKSKETTVKKQKITSVKEQTKTENFVEKATPKVSYARMKTSELTDLVTERGLTLPDKKIKKNLIEILQNDDNGTETKPIIEAHDDELDEINMKFDAKEEDIVTKVSEELISMARNSSNIIDDITVDVRLVTELGAEYNKRVFAKVQRRLKQSNIDINFTSSDLENVIADYSAITEEVDEDEINYAIDSILKGMDTRHESDEVKNFLSSINEYPLLPIEKELELGKIIAQAHEKLNNGEELDFFENEDYENARELLSLSNKRLVVSVAKKYLNRGMDLIDLVMEGMLGLEKAIIKYDYTTGFKFSTYATWWVRQGVTRAIADKSRVIRVPVHMVETINKVTKIQRELTQELGQEPTYEQIGEKCTPTMTVDEIEYIFNIARDPIALEMPIGDDNSSLEAFIEDDKNMTQIEESEKNELRRKILEVIEDIPEREGEVLLFRYGLYSLDTEPFEQRLEELETIYDKLTDEKITNEQISELILESEILSPKYKEKHGKRIAQNNEKLEGKYEKLKKYSNNTDKRSIEKVKKIEQAIIDVTNTNSTYLKKLIEVTSEKIEITKKVNVITEGVVKPLTLEEVGKLYDVTRERIRQIETKGKRKLKAIVDNEDMQLFLS